MKKRTALRIIVLMLAAVFAAQALPAWLSLRRTAAILPALSPYAAACSIIARRSIGLSTLLALPLLLVALWRGRWFCFHMCPTGFLAELAGKLRRGAKSRYAGLPNIGPWIALIGLGGALAGYPLFIWLDPLAIFNGFFSAWRYPMAWTSLFFCAGLAIILLLSILRPNAWCLRLCPLGAAQELLGVIRKRIEGRNATGGSFRARRGFLVAGMGAVLGFGLRRFRQRNSPACIRPPGAIDEAGFVAVCERCGNCVRACPMRIIVPDLGETGIAGILTPVIHIGRNSGGGSEDAGYCAEFCNECNKVCPTGAIRSLSLEAKRNVSIGTAYVDKSRCIAWAENKYCMVCSEYCPYKAVETVARNNVNCPEVIQDLCRGCGLCQTQCPAIPAKAIVVHPRNRSLTGMSGCDTSARHAYGKAFGRGPGQDQSVSRGAWKETERLS